MSIFALLSLGSVAVACGSSEDGDDPDPGCLETLDSCTGEKVCVGGACEAAFPRVYELRVEMIQFPPMDPSTNDCWDTPCSPPDPFILAELNGQEVARTTTAQDQNSISFPGVLDISLIAGATLIVGVVDEDIAEHDPIGACRLDPVTPENLRARVLSCTALGGLFSMRFRLDPKQ